MSNQGSSGVKENLEIVVSFKLGRRRRKGMTDYKRNDRMETFSKLPNRLSICELILEHDFDLKHEAT